MNIVRGSINNDSKPVIEDELIMALGGVKFPGGAPAQVVFIVIGETYGRGRKQARISMQQFMDVMDLNDKATIRRAIKKLEYMRVITVDRDDSITSPIYSIQRLYRLWRDYKKQTDSTNTINNNRRYHE